MNIKRILMGISILALGLMAFKPAGELAIGSALPKADIQLQDVSGKVISLQSAIGNNVLLVMFSCNTCPYIIKNKARSIEACDYAIKNGMGIVVLNSNEANRGDEESFE